MRFHEFAQPVDLDEAFNDLGKNDPADLVKGQPLDPKKDDNFHKVDARTFYRVVSRLRANDFARLNANLPSKGLHTLEAYPPQEYASMHCYIGKNNSSGFAIKDGNLVSVFSTQRSSGDAIVAAAVQFGAKTLDCFATRAGGSITGPLFRLYMRHGFHIDQQMNSGTPGEPYAIVNGVSSFVNDQEQVEPENPSVVVFMRRP
jgi:hypothetical protein